jgi:glycosyltransferase involved in cell wall biosynthesis
VSALVPYKRLEVAIQACAEVGVPLKVVGKGPEDGRLRRLAQALTAEVEFTGWLPDDQIRDLYQRCRAVVMPGVEDFGMVPVEAQACGRPVVALARGGAVESVVDGLTGVLVQDASAAAFAAALREVSARPFDSAAIRRHAEAFGKARFQQQFQTVIESESNSERRGSHHDPREVGARRPIDPAGQRNATRYRQRPYKLAARENKS